jgi:hypothetical protein
MTPSGGSTALVWRRDITTPARIYQSTDERFEIVYDPEGWHLWDGHHLVGVYATLRDAKTSAGQCD